MPRASIGQIDREVLDRFQATIGFGSVGGPYMQKGRKTPIYHYVVEGRNRVRQLYELLQPHLGTVKRQQFERVLSDEVGG